MNKALFSSKRDDWRTPNGLFADVWGAEVISVASPTNTASTPSGRG